MKATLVRAAREESGTASLEAALVLPFVLVLGLGTIEFGWLMAQVESVQVALRDAARYASRSALARSGNTFSLSSATAATINSAMQRSFQSNAIDSWSLSVQLVPVANSQGAFLAGSNAYRIEALTQFTPAGAGLLAATGISLPRISLRYEVRHAGG